MTIYWVKQTSTFEQYEPSEYMAWFAGKPEKYLGKSLAEAVGALMLHTQTIELIDSVTKESTWPGKRY
jgi:hypothetical protein